MCRSPFRVIKNGLLSVLFVGGLTRGLDESVGSLRAARRPIERPSERSEAGDVQRLFHDFAFTSSLRDSMRAVRDPTHQIDRKLNIDTCMAEGADCSGSQTALCCQGGCSWSETCFCQPNDGLCFNFGEEDRFCCSNRCGHDGRCQCIAEGESCAAGDYCCGGLNCVGGTCSGDTSAPSPEPTLNPSASPITSPPVISVSSNVNELMNDKCLASESAFLTMSLDSSDKRVFLSLSPNHHSRAAAFASIEGRLIHCAARRHVAPMVDARHRRQLRRPLRQSLHRALLASHRRRRRQGRLTRDFRAFRQNRSTMASAMRAR